MNKTIIITLLCVHQFALVGFGLAGHSANQNTDHQPQAAYQIK